MPSSSISPSVSPSMSPSLSPSASISPSPSVETDTIVTLAEMRSFLNIPSDQTDMNTLLSGLIDAYSDEMEQYLGVTMINSTYTETYDGNGTDSLFLKHYPIASVTSLTLDSTLLVLNTDYYIRESYIKLEDDVFTEDLNNVAIVYVAGHGASRAAVSNVLKMVLKTWVMRAWKSEVVDFNQRFDESSMANIKSQMMPWDIKQKLDYYRCRHWGRD